jgi:membrane-associated phospholipid phosphatase
MEGGRVRFEWIVNADARLVDIRAFLDSLRAVARRLGELDQAATTWCMAVGMNFDWWVLAIPSRLGDGWVYASLVLALRHFGHRTLAAHITGCLVTAWGGAAFLKIAVRRRRRLGNRLIRHAWLGELKSWSFPSQHAACAVAFAAALYPIHEAFPIAAALALGICASRVAIGSHYVGDVLAGVALGIAAAGVWG